MSVSTAPVSASTSLTVLLGQPGRWPARRWVVALVAGVAGALLIGVPTGVIPTAIYRRMTPTTWWDYPVWAVSAVLVGLTAATLLAAVAAQLEPSARCRRWQGGGLDQR